MASKSSKAEHFKKRANPYLSAKKRFGPYCAVRMARNLGIDFEDAYEGFFGRAPRPDTSFRCMRKG